MSPFPRAFASSLCVFYLLCGSSSSLFPQEDVPQEEVKEAPKQTPAEDKSSLDPISALELDIKTSTLVELAAWCRELGLSESGTKDELIKRLRDHLKLTGKGATPEMDKRKEGRTVVVEAAQGTEYFTLEVVNEEYARLRGGVVVSFKDGEAVHRIKAREILYNRTRNTLNAVGAVEYEKASGDSREYFRGESLNVDIDTWTGVFLGGLSEKTKTGEETGYRFSADVISRAPEGVTVLNDATVTTASEGDSYWSLAATRIWLLPGSEWAVANAVLKVGEIPLLYIPFFYLPGDELIFHPVMGYRTREGSYVQTTTYVLGRPIAKTSTEKSIMTMLEGDSNEERRQEGIFLRRTGKRAPDDSGPRLSLLMDAYANLGYYLGVTASAPKGKVLTKAEFALGIGFSRDVYELEANYYSPFTTDYPNGKWNSSRLFSTTVPYRYRLLTSGSVTAPIGSISWNVPFYSDPYIDQDFLDRSENMDWMNLAKQGSSTDTKTKIDVLGSYELSLSGSFTPDIKPLSPWIGTLSLSSVKSALSIKAQTDSTLSYPSLDRTFFYPEKLSILSLSGTISGKLLSFGSAATVSPTVPAGKKDAGNPPGTPPPPPTFGEPRAPWAAEEVKKDTPAEKEMEAKKQEGTIGPPVLSQTFSAAASGSPSFQLGYSMTPSFASDVVFNTAPWTSAAKVDWNDLSSVLISAQNSGAINATAALPDNALSSSLALNFNAAWQTNAYINEKATAYDTEEERTAATVRSYSSTYLKSTGDFTVSAKPFTADPMWSATSFDYSLKGNVLNTRFDGTAGIPHWSFDYGAWNADNISTHSASLSLAALVRDLTQNLKLSTSIYPRPSELSASSIVRVWKTTTSISAAVLELEEGGTFDPITFTETVDLGASRSFAQSLIYDPEAAKFTTVTSTLNFGALSAAFSAKSAVGYSLDVANGWIVSDTVEDLRAQTFTLGFNKSDTLAPMWKNRVNFTYNVTAGFSFDFQRYTQSSFSFALSATLKINKFFDLTLASTSKNSVVFRYFQGISWFDLPLELPGETNPLIDLADSFNFFNESKRRASGFKLKSLDIKAKHYLGDWTAELVYTLIPYLDKKSSPFSYKFENEVSFLVKWTPVPEFKAETYSDIDGFVVK
ncbi:MAG: SAP domain-containing protein [Treponemataceae bacterium]